MMSNDAIILYPTNWLYNASVIGFLDSLEEIEKYDVTTWLNEDGTVGIPREIFDILDCDKRYFGEKLCGCSIIGNSKQYPNYINPSRKKDIKGFQYFVKELRNISNSSLYCGLCSQSFYFSQTSINLLNDKWEEIGGKRDFNIFLDGITKYNIALNSKLGPSIGEFPNSFWNMNYSFSICPLCAYLIIHSHIPFISIKDGDVFINHSSFKVMWYLNKFLKGVLGQSNTYQLNQILGLTLLEFAQKVSTTLGIWSMLNIEMVIDQKDAIDYYSLPSNVVKILLDRNVASLLNDINEPYVFELILKEDFDSILGLNHELLKSLFDESFESNKEKYKYVSHLKSKSEENRRKLLKLLPLLYGRTSEILNQRR